MNIAVVSWLKGKPIAPDLKYGGIENMTRNMALAFKRAGHNVLLFAPPESILSEVDVIWDTDFNRVAQYINYDSSIDFVYDNSCWSPESVVRQGLIRPFASTTHVMHSVGWTKNVIYLSYSQRRSHGQQEKKTLDNPVIPVPAPKITRRWLKRKDYLLFLGIAAQHKGLHYAVELARRLNRDLIVAGPAWGDYVDSLQRPWVKFIGEVYGQEKWDLLERAYAVCCLSDGSQGWVEPGAGVVAEANKMGTPVAALNNGCLPEIVRTGINGWCGSTVDEVESLMRTVTDLNPTLFANTIWNINRVANDYLIEFQKIIMGITYGN